MKDDYRYIDERIEFAKNEGKAEGKIEGKAEGKSECKIEDAVKIIKKLNLSVSDAMSVLEIPDKEHKNVVGELQKRGIPFDLGQ